MIAKLMWECTVRRIQGSRALQVLGAICVVDYLGYLFLASSERMGWTSSIVLFLFSIACWFWAVTWPPFWNHLTLRWQSPGARATLSFVERFGIVSLFFVQIVYTVIFIAYLFIMPR
ncbi:MAG: hypothetical protein ACYTHM_12365 [Planctomycetota bacterium]|jgi:hypothetical protein